RLTIRAWVSMSSLVLRLDFLTGRAAGSFARQNALTGHRPHFGFRATQITAPRSRSAELKVEASDFGRRVAACCQRIFRATAESMDSRKLKSRAKTRAMLASTIGTVRLNAKVATACAVYLPIPGSRRICPI